MRIQIQPSANPDMWVVVRVVRGRVRLIREVATKQAALDLQRRKRGKP